MAARRSPARAERGLGGDALFRAHRRDHRDGVLDRVEHDHDGRAQQHRVGDADRIGIGRRQFLHQPHHVVAEIAEDAGRHGRQRVGQLDPAFGDQRAQGRKRRLVAGREGAPRRAVDLGAPADGAPDQVGLEPDDRIAPAHRAAFDRFQQKAHRPAAGDLEEGRHRRFEVGDQRGPHHLRLAARIAFGERGGRRLDLHRRAQLSSSVLAVDPVSTCRSPA